MAAYQSFFAEFTPDTPVVYVFFIPGKQSLQIHQDISTSKAAVLAHSSDDEVQRRVAKVLYADATADGRLSANIGSLFTAGVGTNVCSQTESHFVPEEHGMDSRLLAWIDTITWGGIREGAYPGCQVVILKDGKEMCNKALGAYTWNTARNKDVFPMIPTSMYDVASSTKTTATLLAVMKLYDKRCLNLADRVFDYLPYLEDTNKSNIAVREPLFHQSGLPSTLLFYQDAIDKDSYSGTLFKSRPDKQRSVRIGQQTWANPKFHFHRGLTSKVRADGCALQVCDSLRLNESFKKEYL